MNTITLFSFLSFFVKMSMLNLLGDVAGRLEMVMEGQMAWEASRGLFLSSWMFFSTNRPQNKPLQVVLQDVLMLLTRCPNAPTRSLVLLQDPAKRNRGELEGGIGLREGERWKKQGKGVARTSSELNPKFVRWLDFLNKPRKLFLWNDELVEGLGVFW